MSAVDRLRRLETTARRRIAARNAAGDLDVIPVRYYDLLPDGRRVYVDTPPPDEEALTAKVAELLSRGRDR